VAEWLKAHAWKACLWQHNEGSNPFLSARKLKLCFGFFISAARQKFIFVSDVEIKKAVLKRLSLSTKIPIEGSP
jgi:hypothetical protein